MSERAKAAAERIREQVDIVQVLDAYGYDVRPDAGEREQQFRCDLHGSGHDDTPSARAYPDSNSFYCFGCGLTYDAIALVRVKEDCGFWDAVKMIERAHGLEPLPIDYGADPQGTAALSAMRANLAKTASFDDEERRLRALLDARTQDRDLPLDLLLSFWDAFDKAVYHVRGPRNDGGVWSEDKGRLVLSGLRERIQAKIGSA
jgi:hypothetical protein